MKLPIKACAVAQGSLAGVALLASSVWIGASALIGCSGVSGGLLFSVGFDAGPQVGLPEAGGGGVIPAHDAGGDPPGEVDAGAAPSSGPSGSSSGSYSGSSSGSSSSGSASSAPDSGDDAGGGSCSSLDTTDNCGACGVSCDTKTGAPSCDAGTCLYACASGRSDCNAGTPPDTDGCECATPGCCGSTCETTHDNGVGDSYYDCNPVDTFGSAAATAACTAFAKGDASMCSDGWYCNEGENQVCYVGGGKSCQTYCWTYSGQTAGTVSGCSCPATKTASWN